MENTADKKIESIVCQYAVRIALDAEGEEPEQGKALKGSGMLFIKDNHRAIVLTAAHVMDKVFQKDAEPCLCLNFFDESKGQARTQRLPVKKVPGIVGKDRQTGDVCYHPEYDRKELYYDLAIILISWEPWMESVKTCPIGRWTNGKVQAGYGFPDSGNQEYRLDRPLAGRSDIRGRVQGNENLDYSLQCIGKDIGRFNRDDALDGFSGTGLFEQQEGEPVLVGFVRGPYGDRTSGVRVWASPAVWAYEIDPELNSYPYTVDYKEYDRLLGHLGENCKKQISLSYNPSFSLEQLEPNLYTDVVDEKENFYYAKGKSSSLIEVMEKKKAGKNNLVLIGEGGIGKTATMLGTCLELSEKKVLAVYIPLRSLNGKGIFSYTREIIFAREQRLCEKLMEICEKSDSRYPRVCFLLDGFNELRVEDKDKMTEEIRSLEECCNTQIVISSRRTLDEDEYYEFLSGRVTMMRLPWERVKSYLLQKKIAVPEQEKVSEILGIPLMLKLYIQIKSQKREDRIYMEQNPLYRWHKNMERPVDLLWNYIQCQILNASKNEPKGEYTRYDFVVAAEFIAPFLAREMNQVRSYSVSEKEVDDWIRKGVNYLREASCLKERIGKIERQTGTVSVSGDYLNPSRIFFVLSKRLNLLKRNEEEVAFAHQDFQDILNYIYIEDSFLYSDEPFYRGAFTDSKLPYDLITIMEKQWGTKKVQKLWEDFKFNRELSGKYGIYNILELIKRRQNNDLSNMDFSGMNLQNASLSGTVLSTEKSHASFKDAVIGTDIFSSGGHSAPVTSVAFEPSGGKFVSASYDKTLRIWGAENGNCISVLEGHSHYVRCVSWSPGGEWIASGGDDRRVVLWNVSGYMDGKRRKSHVFLGHEGWISCMGWSGDGKRLASGDTRGRVTIWDTSEKWAQEAKRRESEHPQEEMILWDTSEKKNSPCVDSKEITGKGVHCLLWNPAHRDVLGIAFADGIFRIWDVRTNREVLLSGFSGKLKTAAWSPSGEELAVCDGEKITIWNLSSVWKNDNPCLRLEWNADSEYCGQEIRESVSKIIWTEDAIMFSCKKGIKRMKIPFQTMGGELENFPEEHKTYVNDIAWSFHEKKLVSCAEDGSLLIWRPRNSTWKNTWSCVRHIEGNSLPARCVAWSQDARKIAVGYDDNKLRIWDIEKKRCCRILDGHEKRIKGVAWQGEFIASCSNDGTVKVWNSSGTKPPLSVNKHKDAVNCVIWMKDGKRIISGSDDKRICVWNYETDEKVWLEGHTDSVYCAALSPDGQTLVSGSNDRTIRFWNCLTGAEYTERRISAENTANHSQPIRGIAWSPNEKLEMIISGSNDRTLRRWNAKTQLPWQEHPVLEKHTDFVYCLSWNPKDDYLVSGSTDNTLWIWNAKTGEGICHLTGHTNYAHSAAWSPDGKYIASASCDGTVRLWKVKKPEKLEKEYHKKVKILTALPFINIMNCDFLGAEFDSKEQKKMIKMNGGITKK